MDVQIMSRQRESPAYQVQVLINNENVLMEIDIGSAVTMMSSKTFCELFLHTELSAEVKYVTKDIYVRRVAKCGRNYN